MGNTIDQFEFNSQVALETIDRVEMELGKAFPDDYKSFMVKHNGCEGAIGNEAYLVLWPIDQLIELNKEYAVDEFTPGLIYFGSDGGDTAYAFDYRDEHMNIVEYPFDSVNLEDALICGTSFNDFIHKLRTK